MRLASLRGLHVLRGPDAAAESAGQRRYRPELQGLRAIAVVLVVTYHVWLGRVSGGVDVFFLISGLLVTGQLVRAASRGGIEFGPLWGRMIRRLFPAALAVLTVIMAVGVVALPEDRWFQTIREVVAAALYLENWQLAADSTDYFAQHSEASVVQHFWSLSIQGQFYLVWPLLIALVALAAARTGVGLRRSVFGCLLLVFAVSLAYSVYLTEVDQPLAYFSSFTRVWEFALGGLVALVIDRIMLPRGLRIVLGWLGVAGLVACGLVLQVGSVFPGYFALWPTLCGAAVIVAGSTGGRFAADRLLSSRPLEYLGNLAYALYLWHWPVLVFYLVIRDRAAVGPVGGAGIIALSVLLSVATYHLVEQPARSARFAQDSRWAAYRFGVAMLVPVLVGAGCWQLVSARTAAYYEALVEDPDHPGALAHDTPVSAPGAVHAPLAPSLLKLPHDYAFNPEERCPTAPRNKDLTICTHGTTGPATTRVVVVGDSHMRQYLAALQPIAQRRNWQLIAMLKGSCPFSATSDAAPGDQRCIQWNADVLQETIALQPDFVLANGTRDVRPGLTEQTPPGFVSQWRALGDAGIRVLAIRDNPRYDFSPPLCAKVHGRDAPQCTLPRSDLLSPDPPYASIRDLPPNVSFLDFSDYLCTPDLCPPVIGNIWVYMDNNHLSATFMRTMSSVVEREIDTTLQAPE